MTTIRGGRLASGESADLYIDDGALVDAAPVGGPVVDATGLTVAPGLVDLQINGGFGHDFTYDPTAIWQVGELLPELGVTAFVPTIVTSPDDVTDLAIDVVANHKPDGYAGAQVLGLHFEGPWISTEMYGAHNPANIVAPDPRVARKWADSGLVRMVTLAPESPGADGVIETLIGSGVKVSLGHTASTYQTARRAYDAGATLATHLFNQMTPLTHREPGAVGAALLAARHCLVIVDGLHIADAALEIAWQILGRDRLILVTDAMAALGLGPGTYPLGDGPITVGDDGPRTADGRLAGSVVTLPRAISNLMSTTSATLADAIFCATTGPAAALGLTDRGSLAHRERADVTLLSDDLDVVATYVGGRRLHG